jgi:hypothetical protein
MKRGALLLGFACLAITGCGGKPAAVANESSQHEDRVTDPQKEMESRWAKPFTDARALAAAADEFGYKTAIAGATVTGTEQVLPDAKAPVTVRTDFKADGNAIVLTFAISDAFKKDTKTLDDIQRYPNRIVRGILSRFDIGPEDAIITALQQRKPGTANKYGVTTNVDVKPGAGGANARDITVTISRTNPQESAARK